MECVLDTEKQYDCMFCQKELHRGNSECTCSTMRPEFNYASICVECAAQYDRLMVDEGFKPILNFLLKKEYWRGVGPVIDF